jgi:undecaprenyl-phosphate 4-deoxy-4-formamido-L-arabinose transferase
MLNCQYSVVIPVYNSEKNLPELYERISRVFQSLRFSFEIIFVEDGSQDNSWQAILGLKEKFPDTVRGIRFSKNFGQHNALLSGFRYTKGDRVITMDDDFQTPPEEITKLITKMDETNADLVYGRFEVRNHTFIRNTGSWMLRKLAPYGSGNTNQGSPFRIIKKEIIQHIRAYNQPFVFIDEVIFWHTSSMAYVDVAHESRKSGSSGYSFRKLVGLTLNIVFNYSNIPLRLMTITGFMASLISFLFGIFFIWKKIHYKTPLGYTSLIVTIFFSTGIILLCFGIIGEYISRIYNTQNNKPQYSIKELV